MRKTIATSVAVLAISAPLTMQQEGLVLKKYLDVGGVPTWCYGETEHDLGKDTFTPKECKELLTAKLGYISYWLDQKIKPHMPATMQAALSSWAYNVGLGAAAKSTLLKKANNGDFVGACNELSKWVHVGKRPHPSLIKRRSVERKICLTEIGV